MKRTVNLLLVCLFLAACGNDGGKSTEATSDAVELGPYGPPMGSRAHVVRMVKVETSGAVNGTFSGSKADGETGLEGLCNPNTFANFLLAMPGGKAYDQIWVTNMSKRAIGTGKAEFSAVLIAKEDNVADCVKVRAERLVQVARPGADGA